MTKYSINFFCKGSLVSGYIEINSEKIEDALLEIENKLNNAGYEERIQFGICSVKNSWVDAMFVYKLSPPMGYKLDK